MQFPPAASPFRIEEFAMALVCADMGPECCCGAVPTGSSMVRRGGTACSRTRTRFAKASGQSSVLRGETVASSMHADLVGFRRAFESKAQSLGFDINQVNRALNATETTLASSLLTVSAAVDRVESHTILTGEVLRETQSWARAAIEQVVSQLSSMDRRLANIESLLGSPSETKAAESRKKGANALAQGWLPEAVDDLESACAEHSYDPVSWYLLGEAYFRSKRGADAVNAYRRVLRYGNDRPGLLATAALCAASIARGRADPSTAAACLDEALDRVTDCVEVLVAASAYRPDPHDLVVRALVLDPASAPLFEIAGIDSSRAAESAIHRRWGSENDALDAALQALTAAGVLFGLQLCTAPAWPDPQERPQRRLAALERRHGAVRALLVDAVAKSEDIAMVAERHSVPGPMPARPMPASEPKSPDWSVRALGWAALAAAVGWAFMGMLWRVDPPVLLLVIPAVLAMGGMYGGMILLVIAGVRFWTEGDRRARWQTYQEALQQHTKWKADIAADAEWQQLAQARSALNRALHQARSALDTTAARHVTRPQPA